MSSKCVKRKNIDKISNQQRIQVLQKLKEDILVPKNGDWL